MALLPPPSLACLPLPLPLPLQLNLIHSEVSNLAGFDVEGVINPTTAELELKDDLGEPPHPHQFEYSGEIKNPSVSKQLDVPSRNRCSILTLIKVMLNFNHLLVI